MGEARGQVERVACSGGELDGLELAERRAGAKIEGDVKHAALHAADELSMLMRGRLAVHAAHHARHRMAVIALCPAGDEALLGKIGR